MFSRIIAFIFLLSALAFGGIIQDVRSSISQGNFAGADSQLLAYRNAHGVSPEYLEALSWMGRGSLAAAKLDQAASYAKQTETLVRQQLKTRALDSDPHLAIALGAAFEVQAQVLAARNQSESAIALLQRSLAQYGTTSIHARLQKNLNLLAMSGRPAPELEATSHLGPQPPSLVGLKGSPVLLFFWAHWCGDCKAEAPILAKLRSEYAAKGLMVIAPTQLYGYGPQGDMQPDQELPYIESVRQKYYSGLLDVPVPVSTDNFNAYGASTTPTLVLLDRSGKVSLYHPGAMSYADLRAEIEKASGN